MESSDGRKAGRSLQTLWQRLLQVMQAFFCTEPAQLERLLEVPRGELAQLFSGRSAEPSEQLGGEHASHSIPAQQHHHRSLCRSSPSAVRVSRVARTGVAGAAGRR